MTDKKIATIGIPGKWSTEVLADALEARTGFRLVMDMADISADLTNGTLLHKGEPLIGLDGIAVKKITQDYNPNTLDRLELLRIAEASGIKVFSPAESMLRLIDRLACTVTLRNAGVPMPDTIVTESVETALTTVQKFGAAVFKPLYSTKARGMCIMTADTPTAQLRSQIEAYAADHQMLYIQRKMDLSGEDWGLVFLGGSYLGAYARQGADESWSTVIASGGKYAPASPSDEIIALADKAQSLFNLDYTTVDVAITADGPVIFEVSAFGGFQGAKEGIGIDAAALYADHIVKAVS